MPKQLVVPYYRATQQEEEVFQQAYRNQLPLMLKGPTGCGKSRFVEAMAHKMKRPLIQVSCHDETSAVDLVGRFLIKGQETVWQDGPVVRAMKENAILYLDEFSEAREDVMVVLHPLTDYRRELFIDRLNLAIKAQPEFMVIISFNPGYQRGLKEIKASTRQRFLGIDFTYPVPAVESEIVQNEARIAKRAADSLVEYARKVRALEELGMASAVSTRLLVNAAILIREGMGPRLAVNTAVVQCLTDDLETSRSLKDLADLLF